MSRHRHARRLLAALAGTVAVAAAIAAIAAATVMHSTKLGPRLCETTGGGKFVRIPGFPGEMIDRRLLTDIQWLQRRYRIFITDGYSMDDVHAENGEHPIGLALDIVPDKAVGGRWSDITRLARWAEPRQNHPRSPFRWVGYDGDANHGRGNHLHLSWSHSETRVGRPAKIVDTIRCPVPGVPVPPVPPTEPPVPEPPPPPPPPPTGGATSSGAHGSRQGEREHDGHRTGRGGRHHGDGRGGGRGGRADGRHGDGRRGHHGGHGGSGARDHAGGIARDNRSLPLSGGISRSKLSTGHARLAPVVPETDGVGLDD